MAPDISSPSNERIKRLIRLRERRHRDAEGVFIVEGDRLYRRAIASGLVPEVTFVDDPGHDTVGTTVTVAPEVLDRASYRARSEGLIAVFPQLDLRLESLATNAPPLILVTEAIEKPGNLGAMMRTAAASGAGSMICVGHTADPHNPNAVRASTGSLFDMPLAVTDWPGAAAWLHERETEIVGASPDGTESLWVADLTGPIAIVIGSEDRGLSDEARSRCSRTLAIPQMPSSADSLNASVAAGVILFEAMRQRSQPPR